MSTAAIGERRQIPVALDELQDGDVVVNDAKNPKNPIEVRGKIIPGCGQSPAQKIGTDGKSTNLRRVENLLLADGARHSGVRCLRNTRLAQCIDAHRSHHAPIFVLQKMAVVDECAERVGIAEVHP